MRRVGSTILCVALLAACDWRPFDDLEDRPPVAELKKPGDLKGGFGVSAAMATEDGASSRVMIGAAPGKNRAAIFVLGGGDDPQVDALDSSSCDQAFGPCYHADRVAGIGTASVGGSLRRFCFYSGLGQAQVGDRTGILGRCQDGTEFTLRVPDVVYEDLIADAVLFQDAPEPFVMATDKDPEAALIAGAKNQRYAWFYGSQRVQPVLLRPPGETPESYGAAVAVARLPDGARLLAVGAPSAAQVWLFRTEDGSTAEPVGCLGGPNGFGRQLATGRVDEDDIDELVVVDGTNVNVYSGAALALLEPAAHIVCSQSALPPGALIASFGCGSRESVTGCPGGFGDAVDVGDLDGDGDGEILVGAPGFTARERTRAGAVLVYDVEGDNPQLLTEALFVTSSEQDDRLGSAVVAAPIAGRDVVVAGAPGSSRAFVFYCSRLVPEALRGARCE
jgi:hypothetical protein